MNHGPFLQALDIGSWLRELGLERYVEVFSANHIDGSTLLLLGEQDLEEIGVRSEEDRRTILGAIANLAEPAESADGVPATQAIAMGSGAMSQVVTEHLGERRAVTIMFCDIAEFGRMSATRDPENMHALLNQYFQAVDSIVKQYGGHVDKHIGDTVMAVFGAPVAHTDDPLRAVRAAFEIRRAVRFLSPPVRVHTGIANGTVVASPTGSRAHSEYTVTGKAVNLAARIHDLADPHEILVCDSVKQAVAPWVDCTSMGNPRIKGVDAAMEVWRLDGLRREASHGARTGFVGRAAELEEIAALLATCRVQGRGAVLAVCGEPGIGKTRLVDECRALARDLGFACHTGQVLDFGEARDPMAELVASLLSLGERRTLQERREAAHTAQVLGLVDDAHAVYLNDLLDVPQSGVLRLRYDAMSPEMRSRGKRDTALALLSRRAAKRPQLLIIEDVHWADAELMSYVEHMGRAARDMSVVVLLTSRSRELPWPEPGREPEFVISMELLPLGATEAITLAAQFRHAPSQVARACIERAGGNPLFLEQLLRSTEEFGGELGGGSGGEHELPASLQSIVQARIDNLDNRDKNALQSASVLGQRFTLAELRFVASDPGYTCDALVAHHLILPNRGDDDDGDGYVFAHALVLEGVYASMLKTRQRSLHRKAAEWFVRHNAVLHAEHLERAGDAGAARAYLEAARRQLQEYRFERARQLVERGLALCAGDAGTRADEYELTGFFAEVLYRLGAVSEAIVQYERAAGLAEDDVGRCRAWLGMAQAMRVVEKNRDAERLIDRAEVVATRLDLAGELAAIHYLRGNLRFVYGDVDGCLAQHTRALGYARRSGSVEREAQALSGLGDACYMRGQMLVARDHYARCVDLAREQGLGRIEVANLALLGITKFYQLDLDGALQDTGEGAQAAAVVGDKRAEIVARGGCIAWVLFDMERLHEAEVEHERALELIRAVGAWRFAPLCHAFLARMALVRGQHEQAVALAREAVARCRDTELAFVGPVALAVLAEVEPDVRQDALAEAEALLAAGSISHNHLHFYRIAMDMALARGDAAEVLRHAAALESYTRAEPLPWSDFFIARGRLLAAHLRGERGAGHRAALHAVYERARSAKMFLSAAALRDALQRA